VRKERRQAVQNLTFGQNIMPWKNMRMAGSENSEAITSQVSFKNFKGA